MAFKTNNNNVLKRKCICCPEYFDVYPNELWKVMCPSCYTKYYVPLSKKYTYAEICSDPMNLYKEHLKEQIDQLMGELEEVEDMLANMSSD